MLSRIVLIAVAVAALAGCGSGGSGSDGETVVAAFYPLAFAAQQIAGPEADVRNLTPAGAEPHDIELTPGDVRDVHDAGLVLYLGDGFMPALETAVAQREGRSLDLLTTGIPVRSGDPHVWLDPVRYAAIVRSIGSALGDTEGAEALATRLEELDAEFERGLARCERREIVTSHAAFTYLADRYGLEQVALTGIAPEAEPSARAIEAAVAEVERSGATTVFFEPLVSPRLAETVAREAGVEAASLDPLEGIDEDELAAGADYFSVMRANLAALRKALGCRS